MQPRFSGRLSGRLGHNHANSSALRPLAACRERRVTRDSPPQGSRYLYGRYSGSQGLLFRYFVDYRAWGYANIDIYIYVP